MANLTCYVTILNRSSLELYNGIKENIHGSWYVEPPATIAANGGKSTFILQRSSVFYGSEGSVTYQIGVETISFGFQCSVAKNENYVTVKNGSLVQVSFYANNEENYDWGTKDWGDKNYFPRGSSPLRGC